MLICALRRRLAQFAKPLRGLFHKALNMQFVYSNSAQVDEAVDEADCLRSAGTSMNSASGKIQSRAHTVVPRQVQRMHGL